MNTSTSSLLSSKLSQPSPKNYEAAFGRLSSLYGFGGGIPSLPRKSKKSTSSSPKTSKRQLQMTRPSQSARPQKDYEAAFAQLSSNYGFGGGYPSMPTRQ
ncbi:hypothetical protein BDN70DRAFT_881683 [Pholiota conissans]|uniref:Uncharacterized protein n=1 Tax=Pholiota conissans TaxID=109636 RepID=A0A9P6CYW6_9AGAR|nr:hypothetical protein BDN70DRAFT_881683 [Pholiota conissans]